MPRGLSPDLSLFLIPQISFRLPKMGKQSRAPKPEIFGKGKVTPVQVAFMVDRYLSDNNYTKTLSIFRNEASNLFSRTKGGQAPKGLLSLGAILDEYICLKEQKLMVDNEKCRVEQLLRGMQDAMNAYNSAGIGSISPSGAAVATPIPQMGPRNVSHQDRPVYNCPSANAMHMLPSNTSDSTNFSTPTAYLPNKNKRKAPRPVSDVSPAVKKSCAEVPMNMPANSGTNTTFEAVHVSSRIQSSSHNNHQNGNLVQGSSVARNLFEQPPKPKTTSPCPKTPPQPLPSQVDKSISPSESSTICYSSSTRLTPETIPTNCHVISSKTVILSPYKHIRISSSPLKSTPSRSAIRDHVKGRLDFNDSDKPTCPENMVMEEISSPVMDNETVDIFSTDISDFDFFGTDISISDLLVDIDLHGEGMDLPLQQVHEPYFDFINGPDNELGCEGIDANRASCEPLSGVTSYPSENGISSQGPESLISVKSITKCIQIVSPVKKHVSSSSGQAN